MAGKKNTVKAENKSKKTEKIRKQRRGTNKKADHLGKRRKKKIYRGEK